MRQEEGNSIVLTDLIIRNLSPSTSTLPHNDDVLPTTFAEVDVGYGEANTSNAQVDGDGDGEGSKVRLRSVRNSVNPSWSVHLDEDLLLGDEGEAWIRVKILVAPSSVVLEERFTFADLIFTGVTTKELEKLAALPLNTMLYGFRNAHAVADTCYVYTTKDRFNTMRQGQTQTPPQPTLSEDESQTTVQPMLQAKTPLTFTRLTWADIEQHLPSQSQSQTEHLTSILHLRRAVLSKREDLAALRLNIEAIYAERKAGSLRNLEKDKLRRICESLAAYRTQRRSVVDAKRKRVADLRKVVEERGIQVQQQCEGLLTLENNTTAQVKRLGSGKECWLKERILLESCRIDLVARLSHVYPVEERYSEKGFVFSIRGLAVPNDDSRDFGTNDEERISTALGYLAHMTMLLSKYLHIPLRFIPQYKGSRSSILDPAVACSYGPAEPSPRFGNLVYAFDTHLFGTASGRIPSSVGKQALEESKCPLYWKGLNHASKQKFTLALLLLRFDIEQLCQVTGRKFKAKRHLISLLKDLVDHQLRFVHRAG